LNRVLFRRPGVARLLYPLLVRVADHPSVAGPATHRRDVSNTNSKNSAGEDRHVKYRDAGRGRLLITPCAPASKPICATIIVPTFRAEATLLRALRSALDQTMRQHRDHRRRRCIDDSSWDIISKLAERGAPVCGRSETSRIAASRSA